MKKAITFPKNDSLAYFFEKANDDTVPYAKRQLYTKKALAIISKDPNDSMNRVNYFKVANRYYNMGAMEDYKLITEFIVKKATLAKDTFSLAKAYHYLGDYYTEKSIIDSTYRFRSIAERFYRFQNDHSNTAKMLMYKAILQHNESDYLECENSSFKILEELRYFINYDMEFEAYNLLGVVYSEYKEYKLSEEFYMKALAVANKKAVPKEYQFKATVLNNLGFLYKNQNKHKEAVKFFDMALHEPHLLENRPYIYAMAKDNFAYSQMKLGNEEGVLDMYLEALKIRDSFKIIPGIVINRLHLSEYYSLKGDTLKGINHVKEAYKVSKENNLKKDMLRSLEQLLKVDSRFATRYASEYITINDSLQLIERKNRNKFAGIEFETEELALEKNKLTEQRRVLIYAAVGIIFLLVAAFIMRYQISKSKELRLLQKQQNANEEIYQLMLSQQQKIEEGKQLEKKRISRELHDGVMGRLSSIRLNLFILTKKTDQETIAKCLTHIGEIQNIEKEIKTIAYDLEKNIFSDTIGFVTIVKNLFKSIEGHSEIDFVLEVDENIVWDVISANHKINIYRILQESLQNIVKYADAKNVVVRMQQKEKNIAIAIEDDGVGFDPKKVRKGLGLKNMEERAIEMEGNISIRSGEGKGTKINLIIPV